jgi:hypothetical protein
MAPDERIMLGVVQLVYARTYLYLIPECALFIV